MASGYKFTNIGARKCLNIYGNNVTSLTNNQNVTIWADSGSLEQRWFLNSYVPGYVGSIKVESAVNSAFGLNAYRSGTNWNCDVYPTAGNETDCALTFKSSGTNYKIRLTNYPNRYLTAASPANGANVYWAAANGSSYQLWSYVFVDDGSGPAPGSTEIPMPYSYNQKEGPTVAFQNIGCACTCGMDVAAYYDNRNYSFSDFMPYFTASGGYTWQTPQGYRFIKDSSPSGMNEANTIAYIKRYIAAGIPAICHCLPVSGDEHWVVAYKYTSGSGWDSIFVLDPYKDAKNRTMAEAMRLSCGGTSGGVDQIAHHPSHSL